MSRHHKHRTISMNYQAGVKYSVVCWSIWHWQSICSWDSSVCVFLIVIPAQVCHTKHRRCHNCCKQGYETQGKNSCAWLAEEMQLTCSLNKGFRDGRLNRERQKTKAKNALPSSENWAKRSKVKISVKTQEQGHRFISAQLWQLKSWNRRLNHTTDNNI